MIAGIFLRYFKIYSGTHYIPLSSGSKFCGILGNNGIGKSSILESLDSFINNKNWNTNSSFRKSAKDVEPPHIVPLYLMKHEDCPEEHKDKALLLNNYVLNYISLISEKTLTPTMRGPVKSFLDHISKIKRNLNLEEYYIIPIGIDMNGNVNLSILNDKNLCALLEVDEEKAKVSIETLNSHFSPLLNYLRYKYEYIYIPKEIDSELFTKLETNEIQKMMGESLNEIIKKNISEKTINNINSGLTDFLHTIENDLVNYSYRTSGERQTRLRKKGLYDLIIEEFFMVRKLNKKQGGHWIEIGSLSSGEKQRAIIDIAYSFLTSHRENANNLILAIDEPECSLHVSACFEQFEKLYSISNVCEQLIFTSHWYGYLPIVESGCTTSIIKNNSNYHFDLYDLASYREEVRKKIKSQSSVMPLDIKIKSVSDLIQSIISSCLTEQPYNWLICEGTTEKIYLSQYLRDLVENYSLRIVPVGGASEVKKIFKHLEASYDDYKKDLKGKIFLLTDTDSELVSYNTTNMKNIVSKRIVNVGEKTKLVDISSNPVSPSTEIEDCLNPVIFLESLRNFIPQFSEIESLLPAEGTSIDENQSSCSAMDLTPKKKLIFDKILNEDGMKYKIAKEYSNISGRKNHIKPGWIAQIEDFFMNSKDVKFD